MIALPVQAIRDAIERSDWAGADALLADHEARLRAVFESGSAAEQNCRQSWIELLGAQRALIEELRSARDEAARALEQMGRDRRAVNAYLHSAG